jgi:transcription initiation factor TFIIIB Brf1 subunit/transcription initiation factor TFIIB
MMQFDFRTYWNTDPKNLQSLGEEFVKALVLSGKTEKEAIDMVNQFQRESFDQGEQEEAYNSAMQNRMD